MNTVIAEFCQRVERIPFHGLGLSADAYQPDLSAVMTTLDETRAGAEYVELFRAATPMLASLRAAYPSVPMPYHAEGLWLTQPRWLDHPNTAVELALTSEHLTTLGSAWVNHECASKIVGGYPLGTYLPPLWTEASAQLVAQQAWQAQRTLDRLVGRGVDPGPLLLLELPPLTYFGCGDWSVPEFFRCITAQAPCGLVLDIGHLWTHYRYGRRDPAESLPRYVARFLDAFPLEHVVEIHVAGLAPHPRSPQGPGDKAPPWLDTHGAAIPPILFDMLDQVLANPRLRSLKGIALEVDTKPVALIAREFSAFRARYAGAGEGTQGGAGAPVLPVETGTSLDSRYSSVDLDALDGAYRGYARLAAGVGAREVTAATDIQIVGEVDRYRDVYLPYELVSWGGDLSEMFPQTCAHLRTAGISLTDFVSYWFARVRPIPAPFDFFLIKIAWFVDFVRERLPAALSVAEAEADGLRAAYALANEPGPMAAEVRA